MIEFSRKSKIEYGLSACEIRSKNFQEFSILVGKHLHG
jgi:hypothetical protein